MRTLRWGLGVLAAVAAVLTATAVAGEIAVASRIDPLSAVVAVALACVGASWFAVGVYLALRRARHPLGWFFLCVGLLTQAGVAGEIAGRAGWIAWTSWPVGIAIDVITGLTIFLLIGLLPMLYPSGRIEGPGVRVLSAVTIIGAVVTQAQVLRARIDPAYTWPFGPLAGNHQRGWDLWLPWVVFGVGVVGGWVLCTVRLARARYPERQQLAWLLVAVVAVILTSVLGDSPAAMAAQAAALFLLPVAVAVGIVRYQLLNIDTMVPRAITAGVLVGLVVAVYVIVTAFSGAQLTGEMLPSVVGAATAAIVLLPLQARVRRLVNRFVYGTAADPLRAVTELGAAVARVPADDTLGILLTEVAETFRASGARIRDETGDVVAHTGRLDAAPALATELRVGGGPMGTLELAPRSRAERYGRADAEMLDAMAGTVALAVRATRLADELEGQRDAVVEASARARDRLQRDLHDELGPSLTGLRLGLQALADAQGEADLARAVEITGVLRGEADRAVIEVRRLIDDMRPIDLDGADIAAALRRRLAARPGLVPVRLHADGIPPLPVDVEDAAFRIVVEAVVNAQKHASARAIMVSIAAVGDALVARVTDDGRGMPSDLVRGVGLTSMLARAAALGGSLAIDSSSRGTTVSCALPLPTQAQAVAAVPEAAS